MSLLWIKNKIQDYAHTVLQFEDDANVLQVVYPIFNFVFSFDHSAGQAKEQIDGLNQLQMNKLFGGRNYLIKETVIVPLKRQPAEK